ncbi:hypothetical protein LAZ67_13003315 [Cordylochernes scorpioides]|uniref:Uncharacterized protein n=1 Tax=Cordylochernes scorpioides TaxID=51811 RepID=A0ABY6L6B4_9ARAC|nr:hypothetical protein LAZ67_13003315 [Cordylochernes scorpioides]
MALQTIDMDLKQQLHTPKIEDIATAVVEKTVSNRRASHGTPGGLPWLELSVWGAGGAGATVHPKDQNWWRSLSPNYYFPRHGTPSSVPSINTPVLAVCLAGVGVFILTTAVVLVRFRRRRLLQRAVAQRRPGVWGETFGPAPESVYLDFLHGGDSVEDLLEQDVWRNTVRDHSL